MEPRTSLKKTKRLVILSLMVSQALILSLIESSIPIPLMLPGVKPGLANIITLVSIAFLPVGDTFIIVLVRCLLTAIFSGNPMIFAFSLAGGIMSSLLMFLLYKKASRLFGIVGISIVGAIAHNIGQLSIASVVMKDMAVVAYLPILLVSGIIMGLFVGTVSNFLIASLQKSGIMRNLY